MAHRWQVLAFILLFALVAPQPCLARDSLLPLNATGFGLDPDLLFAPKISGDSQTPFWRIIKIDKASLTPWSAVGNILVPGIGGYCSAFLIAPRVVLSANHCLYRQSFDARGHTREQTAQRLDPASFVFVAALHDDISLDVVSVQEVVTGGWKPDHPDIDRDWMIAVLARPVAPLITPFKFLPGTPTAVTEHWGTRLVVAAYPGETFGLSGFLRFSFNCSILNPRSTIILAHDCQTEGGSSGGPIFIERDGKRRLIGIHTGRYGGNSRHNLGVWINSFSAPLNAILARLGENR